MQASSVVKVPAGGGAQVTIGTGLQDPFGVAVDAVGNVYIADTYNTQVVKFPAGGGTQTTIGTGLSDPSGVAVFAPPPVLVLDSPPATDAVNTPYAAGYTHTATSPAGEPAAMFRVATGTLPPGLRVDLATGNLTGTPKTAGTFTFQVQAGNYATATVGPATTITITVAKGVQGISFTSVAPSSAAVGGATYVVAATGGASSAPVTFTVDSGTTNSACSISGAIRAFAHTGTCLIDANQAGDDKDRAAPQTQQIITVGKGANPLTFTSTAPGNARAGATYTPILTGRPGGPITVITSPTGAVSRCRLTGGGITFTGAGRCVITASDPGNIDYVPATVTQTVTIAAALVSFPADATLYSGTVGQPLGGFASFSWPSLRCSLFCWAEPQ